MNFFTSTSTRINQKSVIALGCFDGVHIGHSDIISTAVKIANEKSLASVVWSFQAPPKSFFANDSEQISLLTPLNEKKSLIRRLGADTLICVPFNEKISSLSPRQFFTDILIDKLNAAHILCGFNYRFGYKGSGDIALLRLLCEEFGIDITVFDEIKINNQTVSSSAIRGYLARGELEMAQKMLGRGYSIRKKVIDGQHLGRKLGFPTINQEPPSDKAPLKSGVYLTKVKFDGKTKYGITNIGMRPTVNGKAPVCETHILDYNGNLYGKTVTTEFIKFIRSEKKFDSLEELTIQVNKDIAKAREIINSIYNRAK